MDLVKLNTIYRPIHLRLVKGLNLLTPEWARLQRLQNFERLSLRSIVWPVELVHGGGTAWTQDGGPLARATSNEPVEATDTWRHLVKRFETGYDQMDAENNPRFAESQIEKGLRYQAADALRSFKRAIAIGFYGKPDAVLFKADGAGNNDDTVTLKDLYGESGLMPKRIRDYITAGKDRIAIVDPGDGSIEHNSLVEEIDETTGKLTLADSGTWSDNSVIVLFNHVIDNEGSDYGRGLNGLLHLTRSQVVHNIDSEDHPDWVAGVDVSNYGKVLNGKDLFRWFEEIEQRSDHAPEWVYSTTDIIAEAGGAELDQRRYNASDNTMKLGFKELVAMGVTVEGRPYTPPGFVFIGSNTALRKLSPDSGSEPTGVVTTGDRDVSGVGGFKQYPDRLGFYRDLVFRPQLTVVSRLGLGVVSGVQDTPSMES